MTTKSDPAAQLSQDCSSLQIRGCASSGGMPGCLGYDRPLVKHSRSCATDTVKCMWSCSETCYRCSQMPYYTCTDVRHLLQDFTCTASAMISACQPNRARLTCRLQTCPYTVRSWYHLMTAVWLVAPTKFGASANRRLCSLGRCYNLTYEHDVLHVADSHMVS